VLLLNNIRGLFEGFRSQRRSATSEEKSRSIGVNEAESYSTQFKRRGLFRDLVRHSSGVTNLSLISLHLTRSQLREALP